MIENWGGKRALRIFVEEFVVIAFRSLEEKFKFIVPRLCCT